MIHKVKMSIQPRHRPSNELSFRRSFAERLKLATKDHDVGELATKLKVTPATLYRWLNAKFDPSLPKLAQLAELTQVNLGWIVTGAGPMDSRRAAFHAQLENYGAPAFVPAKGNDAKPPLAFYEPWLFTFIFGPNGDPTLFGATDLNPPLLIEVRDDSMEPTITQGDLALIDRSFGIRPATLDRAQREGRSPRDGIYAFRSNPLDGRAEKTTSDVAVRRVQYRRDGTMVIRCDNSNYPEEAYSPKAPNRPVPLGIVLWLGARLGR